LQIGLMERATMPEYTDWVAWGDSMHGYQRESALRRKGRRDHRTFIARDRACLYGLRRGDQGCRAECVPKQADPTAAVRVGQHHYTVAIDIDASNPA